MTECPVPTRVRPVGGQRAGHEEGGVQTRFRTFRSTTVGGQMGVRGDPLTTETRAERHLKEGPGGYKCVPVSLRTWVRPDT